MKKILLIIIILCAKFALSDLMITAVMYDPVGTDTGKEWVEIYNPDEDICLEGFTFETGNGNEPDNWNTGYKGSCNNIIPQEGYFVIGEADVATTPDMIATLDLQNGPDGCRIIIDNVTIDTVGWGDLEFPEYYENNPAVDVADGLGLIRKSECTDTCIYIDTDNNSYDFIEGFPLPHTQDSSMIEITLEVSREKLRINNCSIIDEDTTSDGLQIYPEPGVTRSIDVICNISAENCSNVRTSNLSSMNLVADNGNTCIFNGDFEIDYSDLPGSNTLNISFRSGIVTNHTTISYDIMTLNAIEIDIKSVSIKDLAIGGSFMLNGDYDMSTEHSPSIKNIGNTVVDLAAIVTDFRSATDILAPGVMGYSLTDENSIRHSGTFLEELQSIDIDLVPRSVANLSLNFVVPEDASAGAYNAKASFFSLVS